MVGPVARLRRRRCGKDAANGADVFARGAIARGDGVACYGACTVGRVPAGEMSFSFLLRVFRARRISNPKREEYTVE
jgi:hypothetical protein